MIVLDVGILFGVVHVSQPQVVLPLTLLGIALGWAYERTGSLVPPMVAHSLFNLKTLVWNSLSTG